MASWSLPTRERGKLRWMMTSDRPFETVARRRRSVPSRIFISSSIRTHTASIRSSPRRSSTPTRTMLTLQPYTFSLHPGAIITIRPRVPRPMATTLMPKRLRPLVTAPDKRTMALLRPTWSALRAKTTTRPDRHAHTAIPASVYWENSPTNPRLDQTCHITSLPTITGDLAAMHHRFRPS